MFNNASRCMNSASKINFMLKLLSILMHLHLISISNNIRHYFYFKRILSSCIYIRIMKQEYKVKIIVNATQEKRNKNKNKYKDEMQIKRRQIWKRSGDVEYWHSCKFINLNRFWVCNVHILMIINCKHHFMKTKKQNVWHSFKWKIITFSQMPPHLLCTSLGSTNVCTLIWLVVCTMYMRKSERSKGENIS